MVEELVHLKKSWGWVFVAGIALIILGVAAISLPFLATLAFEVLAGAIILLGGITQVIASLFCRKWKGFFLHLLIGLLYAGFGLLLLTYPLEGAVMLTLILAILILLGGIAKTLFAFQIRPLPSWGWILFSGIVSLALGILIWSQMPFGALWILGLFIGIDLLFSGLGLTFLALAWRR